MEDGFAPVTRFRITELAPGCTNCTEFGWPIEKLCQLMTARSLFCLMRCWVGLTLWIVALPCVTVPPAGICARAGRGARAVTVIAARPACRSALAMGVSSNPALVRLGFIRALEIGYQRHPRPYILPIAADSVAYRCGNFKFQSHAGMQVESHARADALDGEGTVNLERRCLEAGDPDIIEKTQYSQAVAKCERPPGLGIDQNAPVSAHLGRTVAAHAAGAAEGEFFAVGQ